MGFGNFLGPIVGGLAGGIAGGTKQKYPKYTPTPSAYQTIGSGYNTKEGTGALDVFSDDFQKWRGYTLGQLDGEQEYFTPKERAWALGPGVARTYADADAARRRATERSIGLGLDPRSGQYEETMGEIDRMALGTNREAAGRFGLQEAMAKKEAQLRSAAMLADMLMADQSHRAGQNDREFASDVGRAQWGPTGWAGALNGLAQGALIGLGASGSLDSITGQSSASQYPGIDFGATSIGPGQTRFPSQYGIDEAFPQFDFQDYYPSSVGMATDPMDELGMLGVNTYFSNPFQLDDVTADPFGRYLGEPPPYRPGPSGNMAYWNGYDGPL